MRYLPTYFYHSCLLFEKIVTKKAIKNIYIYTFKCVFVYNIYFNFLFVGTSDFLDIITYFNIFS